MQDMDWAKRRRRLNLMWFSALPTAIVIIVAGLYFGISEGHIQLPQAQQLPPRFVDMLPGILAFAALVGAGAAKFLHGFAISLVRRGNHGMTPAQEVNTAMFVILGAADAPAIIGIAFYPLIQADWIVISVIVYAFIASVLLKPDFDALYAQSEAMRRAAG